MLTVKVESYDDLTGREQETASSNGGGKEYANYLRVAHNNATILLASDAMEPEDATFGRDLRWIKGAIEEAYARGLEDGNKRNT